ncbi:MAG: hypothetical protein HRT67_12470 [Flavobacteriaceae bacterium]|nr:hypothetical protein [Flavobacteriaceae bacterium]
MKNIVIIAIAFLSLNAVAQRPEAEHDNPDKKEDFYNYKDFSAEQITTIRTKKMTLELDLSKDQQAKIYKLNLEAAKDRKAMLKARAAKKDNNKDAKLSTEERYNLANERLDKQIAHKNALKQILSEAQFEAWVQHQKNRNKKNRAMKRPKHIGEKR